MPGLAGDRAAHRVQPRAEPGRALEGDPVVGRAGPVQLPVGQPADQKPAGQITEGGVDLGQADVVSPGQRAAPGQPPARLAVHERRRHAVGQHGRGLDRCARRGHASVTPRRRSLGGRRCRLQGDRIITPGSAGGHNAYRDRAVISLPITAGADAVMYQPFILAIWASDKVTTDDGSGREDPGGTALGPLPGQAARTKAAAEVGAVEVGAVGWRVTARARLPARRSPKGGCACSASNDNLPSLVLGLSADGHGLPAHAH